MSTVVSKLSYFVIFCSFIAISAAEASDDHVCELYIAPSLTPGCGRGVFAGTKIHSTDIVENTVTIAVDHAAIFGTQLDNYVWAAPDEVHIGMAEFGAGMLYNHRNPPVVAHEWPYYMTSASDQLHAHTTSSSVLNVAERDISVGEEIFVSYSSGNEWLEQRGIVIGDVPALLDPPTVRTLSELEEIGHCLTHVKVCNHLTVYIHYWRPAT